MLDLVEPFMWKGERVGLLLDYAAVLRIEETHGFKLFDFSDACKAGSVKAAAAGILEGLERTRRAVPDRQRAVKWTIDDAQEIVFELGIRESLNLIDSALNRCWLRKPAESAEPGKGPPPAASTGAPNS